MSINLISNNCFSGFFYKNEGIQYNHPFVWGRITEDDLLNLILKYDKIDFNNYTFSNDNVRKVPVLKLCDTNSRYFYTHYAFSKADETPRLTENKENGARNIWYRHNLLYAIDKYKGRIERLDRGLKPQFLIVHDFYTDEALYSGNSCSDEKLLEIVQACNERDYKLIVLSVKRPFLNIKDNKNIKWLDLDDFGYLHILENKYHSTVKDFITK